MATGTFGAAGLEEAQEKRRQDGEATTARMGLPRSPGRDIAR